MYGYGYGYGGGYGMSTRQANRETDYMDVKHNWLDLRTYQNSDVSMQDDNEDDDIMSRARQFAKQQKKEETVSENEAMKEAPLLHSAAQNLLIRGEGNTELIALSANEKTAVPIDPAQQQARFEELSSQLDETYDYRSCTDCKVTAKYVCIQCHDAFCSVCYASNHRRGKRAVHQRVSVELYHTQRYENKVDHHRIPHELPPLLDMDGTDVHTDTSEDSAQHIPNGSHKLNANGGIVNSVLGFFGINSQQTDEHSQYYSSEPVSPCPDQQQLTSPSKLPQSDNFNNESDILPYKTLTDDPSTLDGWWRGTPRHWLRGRAKFIPLRLNHDERYHLRLLIATITNSNYIQNVDYDHYNPATQTTNIKKRNMAMITNCIAVLTSLIAAKSLSCASEPNCIAKYKGYIEAVLELGLRHYLRQQKQCGWILPLMCLLQDLQLPQIISILGCKITVNIRTVHTILYPRNMLYVLDSNLMYLSSEPICVDTKSDLAKRLSQRKNAAIKELTKKFAKQTHSFDLTMIGEISEQNLLLCLYSIGDHNINLHYTRDICTRMGRLLCGMYGLNHKFHLGIHRCIDNALILAKDNDNYFQISKNITVDVDKLIKTQGIDEEMHNDFINAGAASAVTAVKREYDVAKVYNNDLDYMVHQCLDTSNVDYTKSDLYHAVLKNSPMYRTHHTHLQHVLQTISLWETITHYLPFLMYLSVVSFLNIDSTNNNSNTTQFPPGTMYTLVNNGQGIHRLQNANLLQRVMTALVVCALRGVGSGVVHIGDAAVPNSLTLIDKYLQLNPILSPILSTARYWWNTTHLSRFSGDKQQMKDYILTSFTAKCLETGHRKMLQHFSIHGMDGTGGENTYFSGSCSDGRVVSLWQWCQQLPSNPKLYPLFLLAGFTAFDQVEWD